MQLTPYSYYGDEACPTAENQRPINTLSSNQELLDDRWVSYMLYSLGSELRIAHDPGVKDLFF